jgi:O-antigen ligase
MNKSQTLRYEVYYYVLLLLAVTLPLPFYAINNGFIIAASVVWLVNVFIEKKLEINKSDRIIVIGSTILFIIYVIGVSYSSNKVDAWTAVERKLPLFFFPLVVASLPGIGSKKINAILIGFLISCSAIAFLCVVYTFWFNKQLGYEFVYWYNFQYSEDNLTRKFGFHHVYFCMYLCFCEVIIFYLIRKTSKIFLKVLLAILSVFLMLFMMGLASRMGAIILIVLIALAVFLFIKRSFILKLSTVLGVIALVCFVGYQFPFIREKFTGFLNINVNEYSIRYQASNRMVSIVSTWSIFSKNWIFGVGTGDLNDLLIKEYERINFQEGLIHTYNPHNQYLDTAGAVGIFGLCALLTIMLFPLYSSITRRDFIGLSFSIIVLFSFLTESMLSRQKGVVFFSFFTCILSIHRNKREDFLMKFEGTACL